jgi:FkbM family methyltransferase
MLNLLFHRVIDKFGSWHTTCGYLKYYKVKRGDIIVDAGAYLGHFTILAARKAGETGKVIAFEPDKTNYNVLKKNIASAKLNNVILINKALFNRNSKIALSGKFNLCYVSKEGRDRRTVDCATLDNELKRLNVNKINLIKMDIEGAELEAIDGAKETLKNTSNLAIACYHKRNGRKTGEILEPLLKQKNFKTRIGYFLHPTLYAERS